MLTLTIINFVLIVVTLGICSYTLYLLRARRK